MLLGMTINPALLQQLMAEVEDAVLALRLKRRELEKALRACGDAPSLPVRHAAGLTGVLEAHADHASDPS